MIDPQIISTIMKDCLFKNEELPSDGSVPPNAKTVKGIVRTFGFHPERLENHRQEVLAIIEEIPQAFLEDSGGGWTFMNLPMDKNENQWGEQTNAEDLLVLAIGLGLADYLLPRDMWSSLPGSMPYVVFRKTPRSNHDQAPPVDDVQDDVEHGGRGQGTAERS